MSPDRPLILICSPKTETNPGESKSMPMRSIEVQLNRGERKAGLQYESRIVRLRALTGSVQHGCFAVTFNQTAFVHTLAGKAAPYLQEIRRIHGRSTAGASTRGGAQKLYGCATCNEDAVLIAEGPYGAVLAVADAHLGEQSSEWVISKLVAPKAKQWVEFGICPEDWPGEAMELFFVANSFIVQQNSLYSTSSRTTLALAFFNVVSKSILAASAGDSHVYVVGPSRTVAFSQGAGAGDFFLGMVPASRATIMELCEASAMPIAQDIALVLATDGISTEGIGFLDPPRAVREFVLNPGISYSAASWASGVAEAIVARACEAQKANGSGDDISVAVADLRKPFVEHRGA